MRKVGFVVLLGLGVLLSACSSSASPTAVNTAPTAAATTAASVPPTGIASTAPSPTRSGSAPLPTAISTRAVGSPTVRTASPTVSGTPLPTLGAGQVYRDPQARFSFTLPSNWTQVQAAGAEVAYQSPAPAGTIPATVNIVLEKLPSATVTLDEYDQAGEANLKQQFPDYKAVSLTKVTIDGKPAYKRVYTATIAGRVLQLQQVYLIERDTAYVISCGAPQEAFAANATVFDQISGTFKIGQ